MIHFTKIIYFVLFIILIYYMILIEIIAFLLHDIEYLFSILFYE